MMSRNLEKSLYMFNHHIIIRIPKTQTAREKGLLAYPQAPKGWGMFFPNTDAIHTVNMKYTIDVVFLSADNQVLQVMTAAPGQAIVNYPGAKNVLELASGDGKNWNIQIGDRITPHEIG